MKRTGTATAIGLFLFLVQLRFAQAALPGQNIWQPLSDVMRLIWPDYTGFGAMTVDAVLLFVIITMTIVEVGKKTNLPKVTSWGVGIALWISAVVALQRTGILLLENEFIMFILFFLTVAGFYWLVKLFLNLFLQGHQDVTQRIVAVTFSIVLVGSFFQNTGLSQGYIGQDGIYSWISLIIALSTVILWVTLIMLIFRLFKGKGLKSSGTNTLGSGNVSPKTAKKFGKTAKSLEQEEIQEQKELDKHEEYTEKLLNHYQQTQSELRQHEQDYEYEANALKAYLDTLVNSAKEMQTTIRQYDQWKTQNNADLPKDYYVKLGNIAEGWESSVDSAKQKVDKIKQAHLKKPSEEEYKTLKKEIQTYRDIAKKMESIDEKAENAQEKLAKHAESYRKQVIELPGISDAYKKKIQSGSGYKKFKNTVEQICSRLEEKEQLVQNVQQTAIKAVHEFDTYIDKLNDLHKILDETHKTGEEEKEILSAIESAKSRLVTGIRTVKPKELDSAIEDLKKARQHAETLKIQFNKRIRLYAIDENYVTHAARYIKRQTDIIDAQQEKLKGLLDSVVEITDFSAALDEVIEHMYSIHRTWSDFKRSKKFSTKKKQVQTVELIKKEIDKIRKENEVLISDLLKDVMDDKKAKELHDTMQGVVTDIAKESKRYYEESLRNQQEVEQKIEGS